MKGLKLEVGERVLVAGRPAELVQILDLDRYMVRFESGELRSLGRAEIDDATSVETPKRAYDDYMQQMSKIGGMYANLAKEAYKPVERILQNGG